MKDKMIKTEMDYILAFSKHLKKKECMKFFDEKFEDLYGTNITILTEKLDTENLLKVIEREVKEARNERKIFLNFEVEDNLEYNLIKKLKYRPKRIDQFNYMVIETEKYKDIDVDSGLNIKKASNKKDFRNLLHMSLLDNAPLLGYIYANKRIRRKVEVYKDLTNNLEAYICYKGDIPVGSSEMIITDDFAKIEDFGILRQHRNKGYGKSILRELLKTCYKNNIKNAYVVTEKNNTVNEMYEKLGFKKIGEKTQLIFSL